MWLLSLPLSPFSLPSSKEDSHSAANFYVPFEISAKFCVYEDETLLILVTRYFPSFVSTDFHTETCLISFVLLHVMFWNELAAVCSQHTHDNYFFFGTCICKNKCSCLLLPYQLKVCFKRKS